MPNIFKKRILDEKLQDFQIQNFNEKIEIAKKWHDDYHNGTLKTDKETSREQAFNQDFFIKILGYKEKPETPYTLEPKQTTEKGQLPDVVLGHFDNENKQTTVVVELKGANIPLDRPQRRDGNMSPIQQAFKYKNQYRSCPFVLASNFFEFRLFQDNQLDYEIWTLDDLVNPENDYYNFKKFYYLLCAENLIVKEGKSKIEELLSDIRIDEENISKSFYKEYKELRLELLRDIYKNNEIARTNIDLAIEKTQKVIDRIVFVCFCEDKGLLPEHILQQVLQSSENGFGSLWSNLKGFFEQIDKGSEKLEIPDGYNGGLFARDNDLNQLEISDDILKKFTQLGRYNFEEDMSVSILGHIFEQSISDLEEIKSKANIEQGVMTPCSKETSKRKKDGIFYTPDYIVSYIIKNSLGKFLLEKEEKLKQKHNLKENIQEETYEKRERLVYDEYRKVLEDVKVLDPACGSGAFLVGVFDFLLAENKRVNDILGGDLFSQDGFLRSILRNNIYGVDINQESVEITKLSLWLKTAVKGKKLTSLDGNIKCGNSLVSDVAVAGERAFDWGIEFDGVMGNGGFDVVLGNPPYVKEYTNKEAFDGLHENECYQGKMDLWYFFGALALDLVKKETGLIGFIAPNNWITNSGAFKFRNIVIEKGKLVEFIDFGDFKVFDSAGIQTMIYVMKKSKDNNDYDFNYSKVLDKRIKHEDARLFLEKVKDERFEYFETQIVKDLFLDKTINFMNEKVGKVLDKIKSKQNFVLEDKEVAQGIVGAPDKAFIVVDDEINNFTDKEKEFIKMFHTNAGKYFTSKTLKYIFYLSDKNFKGNIKNYKNISDHFEEYKDILIEAKNRYKTPNKKYYFLHRERDSKFFEKGGKIICSTRTKKSSCTYTENEFYGSRALNFIKTDRINLKYLVAILNSRLANFWLKYKGKMTGELLQVDKSQLISIPILKVKKDEQQPFINLVDEILEAKQKIEDYKTLLTEATESNNFDREIKLKKEIENLESKVSENEKGIDEMVYKLYGLSAEEIGIVEGN
ncbi:MAG: N-6 DNA methylase [Candidatus Moranbacteria bacterium]|nr:N-6 DNA methylase [Candidatus Moranbacteria bacterium]